MYFVYAIINPQKEIYIGQTDDLVKRLARHNHLLPSKDSSFTRLHSGPWEIFHTEEFDTRQEGMKREKQLKSYQGRVFLRSLMDNK